MEPRINDMDIKDVLINNYMPYAKVTIVNRAIPAIDGMKPANRRILYTMAKMGLINGDKKKSAKIVGQVMTYHPHGDSTIYDTMVRMATGNESLNVPYVESKGNFGKVWSKNMAYAASRYTEAKLSPICNELFEGMNEDAVDMVNNFDDTEKEPALLPVKFPNILVNTSSGIAVGTASSIAPFSLKQMCEATIGLLEGRFENAISMADEIGYPDFPTGGFIHDDRKELNKLYMTGRGTFIVSGKAQANKDTIVITNIPYKSNVETIINEIREYMKTELKEVSSVKDLSDIRGMRVQVSLKRGSDMGLVYKKICRLTKLRTQITFNNSVIIDNRCKTLGVYELLNEWVKFRMETLKRLYTFRYEKKKDQVHLLEAWEKIKDDIAGAVKIIADNPEERAKSILRPKYGLSDKQCEYLMDMKLRLISQDRLKGKLKELEEARVAMERYKAVAEDDSVKKEVIIEELKEIVKKYGKPRSTELATAVVPEEKEVEEISDEVVTIVVTEKGNIKRFISSTDYYNYTPSKDDPVRFKFECKNNTKLLLFTYSGMCYKIPVHEIDCTRGVPKEYIFKLVEREKNDKSDVLMVIPARAYEGRFNVIYADGRGKTVYLSKFSSNRKKYKNVFEPSVPGNIWVTGEDKFFVITRNKFATYLDIEFRNDFSRREAFRVGRFSDKDSIFGVQPASKVPNISEIELSKYRKGYFVKIKDQLW